MIQHSLPNGVLCQDTSDSESVPKNGLSSIDSFTTEGIPLLRTQRRRVRGRSLPATTALAPSIGCVAFDQNRHLCSAWSLSLSVLYCTAHVLGRTLPDVGPTVAPPSWLGRGATTSDGNSSPLASATTLALLSTPRYSSSSPLSDAAPPVDAPCASMPPALGGRAAGHARFPRLLRRCGWWGCFGITPIGTTASGATGRREQSSRTSR